jgi:MFS family permease
MHPVQTPGAQCESQRPQMPPVSTPITGYSMCEARENSAAQQSFAHFAEATSDKASEAYTSGTDQKSPCAREAPTATRAGPLSEARLLGRKTPPPFEQLPTCDESQGYGYRQLAGLLLGYALLTCGNGLYQTLIPVRLVLAGAATFTVGLVQSSYYFGFLLGAVFARHLIDRIGQHRVFIAFTASAAILALAFATFESIIVLVLVRLLTGFAFMGLYAAIESWLNGTAPNERRGQIFASYTALNYLSLALGQLLLVIPDSTGLTRFCMTAALFAAAIVPVSLLDGWPARVSDQTLTPMRQHTWGEAISSLRMSTPLAIPGCVLGGFLYSSFYSLTPLFLVRAGFSNGELSAFMSLCLFSALCTQWPAGRLSDRIDRRRLVHNSAATSLALSVALTLLHERVFIWVLLPIYVAITFTQYGLIVSHTNDRTAPHMRVAMSSILLVLFSFGAMTGPAIASALMTLIGENGLFAFNAISCAFLALSAGRAIRDTRPTSNSK